MPGVKVFRKNIGWKKICLAVVVIALYSFFQRERTNCESLPEFFGEVNLPACPGCWRLKIRPDVFSGQVLFPKGRKVDFDLDYENDGSPIQIQNKFGEILTVNPRINSSLGINRGNEALQFKGNGYVRITILRVWQPGDF